MNFEHQVSGAVSESVLARTSEGVSGTQRIPNPPAQRGAGSFSNPPGSDWTELLVLAALFIFMGQALVWSLPG